VKNLSDCTLEKVGMEQMTYIWKWLPQLLREKELWLTRNPSITISTVKMMVSQKKKVLKSALRSSLASGNKTRIKS